MNKTKFLELVKNPELIEEKDLTKLDELISEHPYSQIIHVLKVKGRKVFNKPDFNESLNLAATYTYDRTILHSIIEGGVSAPAEPPAPEVQTLADDESITEETSDFSWINEGEDEDIFIDEIPETVNEPTEEEPAESAVNDIPEKEKAQGEDLEQEEPQDEEEQQDEEEPQEQEEQQEVDEPQAQELQKIEGQQETEGQQVIAAEQVQEPQGSKDPDHDEEAPEKPHQQKESPDLQEKAHESADEPVVRPEKEKVKDPLETEIQAGSIHAELMKNLSQLQESKQQLNRQPKGNGGPKGQEQQIEIIDNFIRNSPVLSKPNLNAESEAESQDDLSKDSTKLNDELASENLAKIYLKQGKRKDAEKIYKKLIRKFPQKKGYFADQIQKIKKK